MQRNADIGLFTEPSILVSEIVIRGTNSVLLEEIIGCLGTCFEAQVPILGVLDTLYAGILSGWIFCIHYCGLYRREKTPFLGLEFLELYRELR